jgi:hypothetical protein
MLQTNDWAPLITVRQSVRIEQTHAIMDLLQPGVQFLECFLPGGVVAIGRRAVSPFLSSVLRTTEEKKRAFEATRCPRQIGEFDSFT